VLTRHGRHHVQNTSSIEDGPSARKERRIKQSEYALVVVATAAVGRLADGYMLSLVEIHDSVSPTSEPREKNWRLSEVSYTGS
jgi:hypothetical protein